MNISRSLRPSEYGFNNTLGTIQIIHSLCFARRIILFYSVYEMKIKFA